MLNSYKYALLLLLVDLHGAQAMLGGNFYRAKNLQKLITRVLDRSWDLDWRDENNATALDLAAQDGDALVTRKWCNG